MGCDNTLRLKKIGIEEFISPLSVSNIEQAQSESPKAQGYTKCSYSSKTLSSLDQDRRTQVDSANLVKKFNTESRRDQNHSRSVPPMNLMALQDIKNTNTVWHRQSDPLLSPTKSVVHTCGDTN